MKKLLDTIYMVAFIVIILLSLNSLSANSEEEAENTGSNLDLIRSTSIGNH